MQVLRLPFPSLCSGLGSLRMTGSLGLVCSFQFPKSRPGAPILCTEFIKKLSGYGFFQRRGKTRARAKDDAGDDEGNQRGSETDAQAVRAIGDGADDLRREGIA